jgi:hypothetical protein
MKNWVWTEEATKIGRKKWQGIIDSTKRFTQMWVKRSGKDLYCAARYLSIIRILKKNIAVMCWQDHKRAKETYMQAMGMLNVRREFIVYKHCIRHKKTGGKIFFKIVKPKMNTKIEFKGSKTWTL